MGFYLKAVQSAAGSPVDLPDQLVRSVIRVEELNMAKPKIAIIISTTRQLRFGDKPTRWLMEIARSRGDASSTRTSNRTGA
jgi:hypothetical protein